ncbi:ATP-binding protein [Streptomyces sp. SID3343]|nr:ATP-binding protein [Streptomyces sp. SID3343]
MFAQDFSATPRGARLARRLATYQLATWGIPYGSPASDSAALVVAELASNAVLHACVPGRGFALRLTYDSGTGVIRIEVSDHHPRQPVSVPPPSDADNGRGLILVDAVSDRWGTSVQGDSGKTVFAEIEAMAREFDNQGYQ